jgi:hypothetical protein
MQIPREIRTIRKNGRLEYVPIKSHPDFVVGLGPFMCVFDAKSTEENIWNLKRNVFRHDSSANKKHQWDKLQEAHNRGVLAGYLIWFLNQRRIVWASVPAIYHLIDESIVGISPESPYVTAQPDDLPIDLERLVHHDLETIRPRLETHDLR